MSTRIESSGHTHQHTSVWAVWLSFLFAAIGATPCQTGGTRRRRLRGGIGQARRRSCCSGADGATSGHNILIGGPGRNLLIDGSGSDILISTSGQDILIGGTTSFDHYYPALFAIMQEWTSTDSLADRIADLDGTGKGKRFEHRLNGKENHHASSHHGKDQAKLDSYKIITRWHVEQFVYLLTRLKSIKEGERTLLDNSMIMCGSSLSDGDRHDPNNLPILLGGKGGGRIASGRHLAYPRDTPLCNLYVSMLSCMGIQVPRFGDSTERLKGLLS